MQSRETRMLRLTLAALMLSGGGAAAQSLPPSTALPLSQVIAKSPKS